MLISAKQNLKKFLFKFNNKFLTNKIHFYIINVNELIASVGCEWVLGC